MGGFGFKQFGVEHSRSTMKVGTDAILLGAWADLPPRGAEVLDVGCGCGIISLITAQRASGRGIKITAIDLDGPSVEEASGNFLRSPWGAGLKAVCADFREYERFAAPGTFSMILCNPPFFSSSLKCPAPARNLARHNDTLPFDVLLRGAEYLLCDNGVLAVVLPEDAYTETGRILSHCAPQLHVSRLARVYSREGKRCERVLVQYGKNAPVKGLKEEELCILQRDGTYGQAYKDLVKDFYLWG